MTYAVSTAYEQLEKSISMLNEAIASIEARIAPICVSMPETAGSNVANDKTGVPMADKLAEQAQRVQSASAQLFNLLDRVQL